MNEPTATYSTVCMSNSNGSNWGEQQYIFTPRTYATSIAGNDGGVATNRKSTSCSCSSDKHSSIRKTRKLGTNWKNIKPEACKQTDRQTCDCRWDERRYRNWIKRLIQRLTRLLLAAPLWVAFRVLLFHLVLLLLSCSGLYIYIPISFVGLRWVQWLLRTLIVEFCPSWDCRFKYMRKCFF